MGSIKTRENNRKLSRSLVKQGWHNSLKVSRPPAEGAHHRIMKFWLHTFAIEHGIEVTTEATLSPYGRADVVYHDWLVAIEVLGTEKLKRFNAKDYPVMTIPVPATMPVQEVWAMLSDLDTICGDNAAYYRDKILKDIATGVYREHPEPAFTAELMMPMK